MGGNCRLQVSGFSSRLSEGEGLRYKLDTALPSETVGLDLIIFLM